MVLAAYLAGSHDLRLAPPRLLARLAAAVLAAAALAYPLLAGPDRQRLRLSAAVAAATLLLLFLPRLVAARLARASARGSAVFLLGSEAALRRLEHAREAVRLHYEPGPVLDLARAGGAEVEALLAAAPEVVVCEMGLLAPALADRLLAAQAGGTPVRDFVDFYAAVTGRLPLDLLDRAWLLRGGLAPQAADARGRARRLRDLLLALLLLAPALPLMLLVALLVRLDSAGPALFRQERLGRFKRPFTLWKFRTMRLDAERDGPRWARRDDPRVTRVGRILRRFRLDELPQLLNVLRGDLGLVGPRPIRRHFAEELARANPLYDLRFLYRPGLTGWTQVLGPYGETAEEHAVKLEMDLYSFRHATLLDDAYVLLRTARVMLAGRGT